MKVAAYRSEIDHLFRLANYDYSSCVGILEIENWQWSARRAIENAATLSCPRAKPEDRQQFSAASNALTLRLLDSDERISELRARNPKH